MLGKTDSLIGTKCLVYLINYWLWSTKPEKSGERKYTNRMIFIVITMQKIDQRIVQFIVLVNIKLEH